LLALFLVIAWRLTDSPTPNVEPFQSLAANRTEVSGGAPPSVRPDRVLLLGVDGLSWQFLARGFAQGRLPHFRRICREGAVGLLQSVEPLALESPTIWTTIETGVSPATHGITGFFNRRGSYFFTFERRSKAIWNILSDVGKTVGVVGPLYSFPAEKVNGVYISDRGYGNPLVPADRWRLRGSQTYPPEELEAIADLVRGNDAGAELLTLAPESKESTESASSSVSRRFRLGMADTIRKRDDLYAQIAQRVLTDKKLEFLFLYLMQVDAASHFSGFREEKTLAAYARVDEILGRLMALGGDRALVVVCSDHGFRRARLWNAALSGFQFSGEHDNNGVLIAWGPGAPTQSRFAAARVYDVAPTILRAFGLDAPAQMEGRTLINYPPDASLAYPPGYSLAQESDASGTDDATDQEKRELRERLRALGYVK
jgi:predicted AlkP superfamily phosphohydrolase/phosphomutase